MRAAAPGIGLASTLVHLVLAAAAHPQHDVGLQARSAPFQPHWDDPGLFHFGDLPLVEDENEINRPVAQTPTALEVADTTSMKLGESNTQYQIFSNVESNHQYKLKQDTGRLHAHCLRPLSVI